MNAAPSFGDRDSYRKTAIASDPEGGSVEGRDEVLPDRDKA